jgi:hypothetical protein
MSITATKAIPCRACGDPIEALTIESANPTRHPWFQEKLLDRTLLRMSCPHCGAPHVHLDRFAWTDLPGLLCACVLREEERSGWRELEVEALAALSLPLHEEGPPVVREWGQRVAIRLVFGLEELREKVICRIHALDDRLVEALKTSLGEAGELEAVTPGERLSFRVPPAAGTPLVDVPWAVYERTLVRREALAAELPDLFDERSTWVNAGRRKC